jgi:monoamine oxidase
VVELGAEFVEHDHRRLVATARRLGLAMAPTGMAYGDREPRGGLGVDRPTLRAAVDDLRWRLAERPDLTGPGRSAADVLEALPLDPGARQAIAARLQVSAGQPVDRLAAAVLEHAGSTFSTQESLRVGGGNQRLALRLAERLPGAVHLGVPVRAVGWAEGGVRVAVDGAELEAEACLLTVPASVVGRIRFDPPLSAWKAEALGRVSYGHAAKLFVPLRQVPPPSAVLSVPDHYWTWTARGADGTVQPVVSAFAGSAPALADLKVAEGPATWRERLQALRPDLDLDPGALLSTWDDDPWVGAAYSTRTPASRPDDPDLLARPCGPLHFAGEHTAGPWAGLMEGALRSGHRAAADLLATGRQGT